MKNNFPKIAFTVALTLFIIPQVTFAAWWNPFTWGIFHKSDVKTQIYENRLDTGVTATSSTSTPKENIATTTAATTTPVVKKEVKKVTPVVDNSAIIQAQVKAQVEAQLKIKADQDALIAKQKADEQARLDALKVEVDKQAAEEAKQNLHQEPKGTTIDIKDVTCSWGGSDNVYILPFSISGSWSGGLISITSDYVAPPFYGLSSGVRPDSRVVRRGGLLYKSDLARDGGFIIGSESGLSKAKDDTYSYKISLYSEGPYFRSVGPQSTPYFPGSSLLVEKSGTFRLPSCSR